MGPGALTQESRFLGFELPGDYVTRFNFHHLPDGTEAIVKLFRAYVSDKNKAVWNTDLGCNADHIWIALVERISGFRMYERIFSPRSSLANGRSMPRKRAWASARHVQARPSSGLFLWDTPGTRGGTPTDNAPKLKDRLTPIPK